MNILEDLLELIPDLAHPLEERSAGKGLPDVGLGAAVSSQLVLGEVGVVGGGDEVVSQRLSHVLVNSAVLGVEHTVLLGQHVHGEAVGSHELVLLGCPGEKEHTHIHTCTLQPRT